MKRILILLLGLFSVAYGQFSPTSAKSAFKWGVSIGTRDSTAYAANDSLVVVINRQGRMMYRSTDGYWKLLSNIGANDYVPYNGANANVFLGSNRIKADAFDLGIPSSSTDSIGRMRWNADDLTMNIGLTSSVVLQSGQEMLILVKNQTGVTIPNGTVVRQSGVVGASGRLKVEPFLANGTHNSNQVLGLTTEDIPNGADGFVAYFGKVNKVNTAAYPDSTILYASPTVAGGLTNVVPEAPNNIVKIGTVVKSASSNGIIFTRVVAGSNINQDEGVELTNPLNNSLLVYDSLTTLWKDKTLVEIGAVRVQDTAAMLAPYLRKTDTTGLFNNVVRTFGDQTINGIKTFNFDGYFNSVRVGKGGGSLSGNTVLGGFSLWVNTTGDRNTAVGFETLKFNTTGAQNSVVGNTALTNNTGGSENTVIGTEAMYYNTTGSQNTAIGDAALFQNSSSALNVGVGYASLYYNGTGANNTAIGAFSGGTASPNRLQSGSNNIFIGHMAAPSSTANNNEIVIGASTTGNGSNTVTIGNSSVTGNYFNGFLKQTSVTSALVKASASGQFEAAVAGTDYVIPSALSGYVDLTSTQNIGGSKTFTNRVFSPSLSINNTGTFARLQLNGVDGQALAYLYNNSGTAGNVQGVIIEAGTNASDYTLDARSSGGTSYLKVRGDGTTILGGALNGTSLSMSGGAGIGTSVPTTYRLSVLAPFSGGIGGAYIEQGEFNQVGLRVKNTNASASANLLELANSSTNVFTVDPSGTTLIAGATTDGTNKLIVNGGVKGGKATFTDASVPAIFNNNGGTFTQVNWNNNGTQKASIGWDNSTSKFYLATSVTALELSTTGAATFSSSVSTGGNVNISSSTPALVLKNTSSSDKRWDISVSSSDFTINETGIAERFRMVSGGAATFSSSVTATGFIVSSDRRLKNIIKRDGDVAYYKWKDKQDDKVHIGYIAQEVQKTNPDQVSENNGKLAVNYIEILVEKVRALEKEIEQLKRKQK